MGMGKDGWKEAPVDAMEIIVRKVNIGDRVRMRVVCKSWKQIMDAINTNIGVPVEPPWLLLPFEVQDCGKTHAKVRFYSMSEEKIYKFRLPLGKSAVKWWVCYGATKNWLVIEAKSSSSSNQLLPYLFLFDPIKRARIDLPPLITIPSSHVFFNDPNSVRRNFVHRLQVMSLNNTHTNTNTGAVVDNVDVVAALFACEPNQLILALCKPQDKYWTIVPPNQSYADLKFHQGKLHVLVLSSQDKNNESNQEDYIVKLGDGDTVITLTFYFCPTSLNLDRIVTTSYSQFRVKEKLMKLPFFVESTEGQLVLVWIIFDELRSITFTEVNEPLEYFRVNEFRVTNLNGATTSTARGQGVTLLGDQTVFMEVVGGCTSVSTRADAACCPGVQKNCIYFALCGTLSVPKSWRYTAIDREVGVFNLEDGRLIRSFPSPSLNRSAISIPCWFTPNL